MLLPSGRRAEVRAARPPRPLDDDRVGGAAVFTGRLVTALEGGHLRIELDDRPLDRPGLLSLPLRDYHALRDAAERLGVIAAEPADIGCRNCDAPLEPDPRRVPRDDLDRWYADDPPPPAPPFVLDPPVEQAAGRPAHRLYMRPVTAGEAWPLWRAIAREGPLEVDARLVAALGIEALEDERDPKAIAEALQDAPDGAWAVIETAFVLVNYAEHAFVPWMCARCGARNEVAAPSCWETEPDPAVERALLSVDPEPVAGETRHGRFPSEADFERAVERIGAAVYEARGVRHLALRVETGIPAVDDAGEPLLGSYEPVYQVDAAGYTDVDFVITLYYRTFARMWEEEGPYALEPEIRETIDHEVQHHLHHLSGHDPMDDEERRHARRELEQAFGPAFYRRAQLGWVLAELRRIGVLFAVAIAALVALVAMLYAFGVLGD